MMFKDMIFTLAFKILWNELTEEQRETYLKKALKMDGCVGERRIPANIVRRWARQKFEFEE